jgi:signal peptide peptidase SppA
MHPLIAAKLYCEPWACLSSVHASICAQYRAHALGERQAAEDPVGPKSEWSGRHYHPQVTTARGIAVVPIAGVIGKHLSTLEMDCGGYDIGLLARQLANIDDDESIHTVVFHIDSPGGMSLGVETAAQQIRALGESGKRTIAYTDTMAASAGYWLAAACDEIHAEASAVVGSISTYAAAIDSSRAYEMAGLELKLFRTGDIKAIGTPGKAWTEKEEEFMQAKVNAADADFKTFIRARRNLTDEEMNGAFWHAKNAPTGLVDSTAFPSLDLLLQSLLA